MPIKSETHKKRGSDKCTSVTFAKRLGHMLNKDGVKLVSQTYIPPYSWYSKDRDVRFDVIFEVFNEILSSPAEYFVNVVLMLNFL